MAFPVPTAALGEYRPDGPEYVWVTQSGDGQLTIVPPPPMPHGAVGPYWSTGTASTQVSGTGWISFWHLLSDCRVESRPHLSRSWSVRLCSRRVSVSCVCGCRVAVWLWWMCRSCLCVSRCVRAVPRLCVASATLPYLSHCRGLHTRARQ